MRVAAEFFDEAWEKIPARAGARMDTTMMRVTLRSSTALSARAIRADVQDVSVSGRSLEEIRGHERVDYVITRLLIKAPQALHLRFRQMQSGHLEIFRPNEM